MMEILVLDNYDSFTYNLVQYVHELADHSITVFRNDEISVDAVGKYECIILSPGPGLPKDAGIMPELIRTWAGKIPILGVCLGHQAIGECFGGSLQNLAKVYHGVSTTIKTTSAFEDLWKDLPSEFEIGRYHSWVINKNALPDTLTCIAIDDQGEIMAVKHQTFPVWGVQFHPESILTPRGKDILKNFLSLSESFIARA